MRNTPLLNLVNVSLLSRIHFCYNTILEKGKSLGWDKDKGETSPEMNVQKNDSSLRDKPAVSSSYLANAINKKPKQNTTLSNKSGFI